MKPPFLAVTDGMDPKAFDELKKIPQLETHPADRLSREELLSLAPKIQGLVIRSKTAVTADLLEKATALQYIVRAGEGTDNVDKAACRGRGIAVSNTPGANAHSVAEHAIGLMTAVLRKTALAHRSMAEGRWDKKLFTGSELAYKKVGIVGLGKIGRLLAKKLSGFEVALGFFDPFVEDEPSGMEKASTLEELFSASDIISLHLPSTEETKGLVGKRLLSLMGPQAVLINTARGELVDEEALCEALSSRRIKGAALDVFFREPLAPDSPLRKLDSVVLTPHIAAGTEEAQRRTSFMAVQQLKAFFLEGRHLNKVDS